MMLAQTSLREAGIRCLRHPDGSKTWSWYDIDSCYSRAHAIKPFDNLDNAIASAHSHGFETSC